MAGLVSVVGVSAMLVCMAGLVFSADVCPGSPSTPHAKCQMSVAISAPCKYVHDEIIARINGTDVRTPVRFIQSSPTRMHRFLQAKVMVKFAVRVVGRRSLPGKLAEFERHFHI